ncbi:signal peptidase [Streptomyces abyssalis]|uniref:Signal peptidase I n=1 Tax=Streptomyces abyssalis TaxID=933944 RepID=A0A1E7JHD9_9ACTN|nr:signal peptidase I [Streptomyces abyssalis]OEU85888.1 signal peptidase [Streptomyces abyssalis]OEU92646.1 signal peptidase [Streptomyces abyssalis]OEV29195.1 signal peptidase [Streptomyces nanshensis]
MSKAGRTGTSRGRLGHALSGIAVAVGCVLFLGAFFLGAFLYQPYTVPTDSMDPTVKAGDRVLAERIDGGDVRRGDVVVFQDSVWGDVPMVKRVVGTGGDKVKCCNKQGELSVNGKTLDEPYLKGTGPDSQPPFKGTTVPEGKLFLLGDHRMESVDSRVHLQDGDHGAVPRSAVDARVDAVAWPMSGLGMLTRPAGFSALPGGTSDPGPLQPLVLAVVAGAALILGGAAYGPIARRAGRGTRG